MAKSRKGLIAEDYCKQYPDMKSYTLGKKMYQETIPTFNSIDAARKHINICRGLNGKYCRDNMKNKSLYVVFIIKK